MPVYRVEVGPVDPAANDVVLAQQLRSAGLDGLTRAWSTRLYLLEGPLTREDAQRAGRELLSDPVSESFIITTDADPPSQDPRSIEVHPLPGVMDPAAQSVLALLHAEGYRVESVRTARRYFFEGPRRSQAAEIARRALANESVERLVEGSLGAIPALRPPEGRFEVRRVALCDALDHELEALSRSGRLFLSLDEMKAVQAHYRAVGREPTDLELETIAQTWSEHCVHKTLKSAIVYRGDPMPGGEASAPVELHYQNLLKDTIARATRELMAEQRGPECLSVFEDNAGVIGFDERFGVAFKVETHNHPSAIEPYGGAATGIGGCIRDVLGCGLGARPIASTDVFCVAPPDWPADRLPAGVLHPRRVLAGVVQGVADYGNRMGIPTVNGAVRFDPRYLGNPLVYCGCVGLIPRDKIRKAARSGDKILLIGGRTGRDGIHGATFSSAELTDAHAEEFANAVQIGNAITEKRCLDAIIRARDEAGEPLFSAITDCGAGGLSSAVGEMAMSVGATVDLERVPLKYAGLRYDEIWISEAQERMVLAVPPARLAALLEILRQEEVEATVIGEFGGPQAAAPRLLVRYNGQVVGDMDLAFLHEGLPKRVRQAAWRGRPMSDASNTLSADRIMEDLLARLASPSIASKEWIIRKYDHEVQGGSVIKPLGGPGDGPNDAAVLRPRLESRRGVALACGMAPELSEVDPYWMALNSMDEAIRNVVCVGGDPQRVALLDNFCWGRADDPGKLGELVRACQACYDGARAHAAPFISGKDSLNNEFALAQEDIEPFLAALRSRAGEDGIDPLTLREIEKRVRATGRLSIPSTLLISAIALVENVEECISADLKQPGATLWLVGGLPRVGFDPAAAARVHRAVAGAIHSGVVAACHDVSEGGWLVALAEMMVGGARGAALEATLRIQPFEEMAAAYVVEARDPARLTERMRAASVTCERLGVVTESASLTWKQRSLPLASIEAAWKRTRPPR